MGKFSISLEELTNGYCLAVANAFRLVEDGETLYMQKRFNGAAGLFRDAVNEIVKAHLIQKAVLLEDSDTDGWELFHRQFHGWKEKLEVLDKDIHPFIYKSDDARRRYEQAHELMEIDFTRLAFDETSKIFLPPGGNIFSKRSDKDIVKILYEYVLGLFHAFNFGGLPDPKSQYQSFRAMKTYPEKV